jgi:flagellar basal body rod protein FlgG
VTNQANAVLGEQGPVTLPNGNVAISSDGTISVDGNVVDKLQLAEFPPGTNLTAVGNSTYSAPAGSAVCWSLWRRRSRPSPARMPSRGRTTTTI